MYACEFFQRSEGYVLFKKANIWTANGEEFLYIYSLPELTEELFKDLCDKAYKLGRAKANIGPNHMCTYVTAVFFCDNCSEGARRALQKCSIHKTFLFSFHGWLDVRLVLFTAEGNNIITNKAGKSTGEFLQKALDIKNN